MTKTRAGKFAAHVGSPVDIPASYTNSGVKVRDVPCPDCQAEPGESCTGATGQPVTTHGPRRRMATRAANLGRDHVSAAFVYTLTTARRRQIRTFLVLSQPEAARFFGTTVQVFTALERGKRRTPDTLAAAYGAWLRHRDPLTPHPKEEPTHD